MDKVKKQHYVPQLYLKAFADNGQIACYDKITGQFFPTNIRDIAEERYFYDHKADTTSREDQAVDIALQDIESEIAPLLEKIKGICSIPENVNGALVTTASERALLSWYMIVQLFRTRKFRDMLGNMHDQFMQQISNYFESTEGSPIEYKNNDAIIHLQWLANDENSRAYANLLLDSCWIFVLNKSTTPFITSDNPVFRFPRYYETSYGVEIEPFFSDNFELHFPLSPEIDIKIIRKETHEYERNKQFRNRIMRISNTEYIDYINIFNIMRARRMVFYPRGKEELIKKYLKKFPEINYEHLGF